MPNPLSNSSGAYQRLAMAEARNIRVMNVINNLIKALAVGVLLFICLTWAIYFGLDLL